MHFCNCRFLAYFSHQFVHILYPFGLWYYLSMWLYAFKFLSIAEALLGHHLTARIGSSWHLVMRLCAAWHLGLFLQHAKLTQLMTSSAAFMMASTGTWERLNHHLMYLLIYNYFSSFEFSRIRENNSTGTDLDGSDIC